MTAMGLDAFTGDALAINGLRSLVVRDEQMLPRLDKHDRVYVHGDSLELYPDRYRAQWKGIEVRLTIRQYLMVEHLASLRGMDASWRTTSCAAWGS